MNSLPVKRDPGKPDKDTNIKKPESTAKSPKKFVFPVLKVDITRDPTEQILNVSDANQSKHLGWKPNEVRSVNSLLNMYDTIPMVCNAEKCPVASTCPTRPDYKFKGFMCPYETLDVYKFFLGYVRDLDIGPTDYVDLKLVEDLIRIDIGLKRIDQQLSLVGMETMTVGGIVQGEGGYPVWEKTIHPLLQAQDKFRNRRDSLHRALIANRKEKFDKDRKEGRMKQDTLDVFDKILSNMYSNNKPKASIEEYKDTVDGEVVSEE